MSRGRRKHTAAMSRRSIPKVPFIAIRARGRCTHDCLRGCISRFFRCSRVLKDILVIALFYQCTRVLLSFRTRFGISLSLAPVNLIHIATILRLRIKRRSIRMSAMTIINSKLPPLERGDNIKKDRFAVFLKNDFF